MIEYLICRACSFDWATTEPLNADEQRVRHLTLIYSRDRDPSDR